MDKPCKSPEYGPRFSGQHRHPEPGDAGAGANTAKLNDEMRQMLERASERADKYQQERVVDVEKKIAETRRAAAKRSKNQPKAAE